MPETPTEKRQRELAERERVKTRPKGYEETEIGKGDLGAAAKEAAKPKPSPSPSADPDAPDPDDSPLVAAAKKRRREAKAKAQTAAVMEAK
jgi:hypothetical protein